MSLPTVGEPATLLPAASFWICNKFVIAIVGTQYERNMSALLKSPVYKVYLNHFKSDFVWKQQKTS